MRTCQDGRLVFIAALLLLNKLDWDSKAVMLRLSCSIVRMLKKNTIELTWSFPLQTKNIYINFQRFEASNRGQFSCRCTLDQWLDLIGVISSWELNILSKSRYNGDLILVVYYISAGKTSLLQVQWEFTLNCFYVHIYIVNGCWRNTGKNVIKHGSYNEFELKY